MTTFLSVIGCLLILLGGAEVYNAAMLNVIVDSAGQTVANFQAMQIQLMILVFGCSMIGTGSVFLTGSCVVYRLNPSADQSSSSIAALDLPHYPGTGGRHPGKA